MSNGVTQLSKLITPNAYQSARGHVFPSATSLQWFMRRNRERLITSRALLMVAGRLLIDEGPFDCAVIEIGHANVAEAA